MPIVIVLDCSLPMCSSINSNETTSTATTTKFDIAKLIIEKIVKHLSSTNEQFQFDSLALVTFSSTAQVKVKFTRDFQQLTESLSSIECNKFASLEDAFNTVSDLVIDEWACLTNVSILMITDQTDSFHENSTKNLCLKLKENQKVLKEFYRLTGMDYDERLPIDPILNDNLLLNGSNELEMFNKKNYFQCKFPFSFPNTFNIICLNDTASNDALDKRHRFYEFDEDSFKEKAWFPKKQRKAVYLNELIRINNTRGKLYETDSLNIDYITKEFCPKLLNELYSPFRAVLKCGSLKSNVQLIPTPISFRGYQDYRFVTKEVDKNLDIVGFISIADLTTPPTLSRHLIVLDNLNDLLIEKSNDENATTNNEIDLDTYEHKSEGSFAYLLNACLKAENMAAIVKLANEWYGAISSWQESKTDPKKKSNLSLSIFTPGDEVFNSFVTQAKIKAAATASASATNQGGPIKSYTKGTTVWYQPANLQSDIQKVIRNAKKMPEKMQLFYKELNKVRRAALSLGFYQLLDELAAMLQREIRNINLNTNADSAIQMQHAIDCLKSIEFKAFAKDIQPHISNVSFNRK